MYLPSNKYNLTMKKVKIGESTMRIQWNKHVLKTSLSVMPLDAFDDGRICEVEQYMNIPKISLASNLHIFNPLFMVHGNSSQ